MSDSSKPKETSQTPDLSSQSTSRLVDQVELRTAPQADLLFHCLAHMDIGQDSSTLFAPEYIEQILEEKAQIGQDSSIFSKHLAPLNDFYVKHPQLRPLNFLPFEFSDVAELLEGMQSLSQSATDTSQLHLLGFYRDNIFNTPETRVFLADLRAVMLQEWRDFYGVYWERRIKELESFKERLKDLWLEKGAKLLGPVMIQRAKGAVIYACLSLTRCGRGCGYKDAFGAAVKFPVTEEELSRSFLWSVHEMTHQFTDAIVDRGQDTSSISKSTIKDSAGFELFLLKEKAVEYADYLLFEKFLAEDLGMFCSWTLCITNKVKSAELKTMEPNQLASTLKDAVSLPEELKKMLEEFVEGLT